MRHFSDRLQAAILRSNQPLYLTVSNVMREAIDSGQFLPGQRLPSTKDLAAELNVSLVTAHRAMRELVRSGAVHRTKGRGTVVHQRYLERKQAIARTRLGMILPPPDALDGYYRVRVLEGCSNAAQQLNIDLLILGFGEDVRNECNGLLMLSPTPEQLEATSTARRHKPVLAIGARCSKNSISWIDIDSAEMGRHAVSHLYDLGHRSLGYIGGDENVRHAEQRWSGFLGACEQRGIVPRDQSVIRSLSYRLDERERMALIRTLSGPNRPTAIFAASYDFAMDMYEAARTVGLRVPQDLSFVGVDDTPSTPHLNPPMTTFRQPLVQLGYAAVASLSEQVQQGNTKPQTRLFSAELVIRGSTAGVVG